MVHAIRDLVGWLRRERTIPMGARRARWYTSVVTEGTSPPTDVETWAERYVRSRDLSLKLAPPPVPSRFASNPVALRLSAPGRPPELRLTARAAATPKAEALKDPRYRARTLHTFFHHELQAAELMCWAVLAFVDAELEFRKGLIAICLDEIRHMNLYREHIERLNSTIGEFEVRDWFWERVPTAPSKLAFVALMGMGFEAANLEHAPSFAQRFRAVGDEAGAALQERIAREELAHVGFATRWFKHWTGGCRFDEWLESIPEPISPLLLRGRTLDEAARLRAGMTEEFIRALGDYVPARTGRRAAPSD
jgi:uncharacterized ferritin-like protein (DUF455 family)